MHVVRLCGVRQETESSAERARKKYVLSLDLNTESEPALIIVPGNEFQTSRQLAQNNERLVSRSLSWRTANGLSSSGTYGGRAKCRFTDSSLDVTTEVCRCCGAVRFLKVNTATLYSILC